MVAGVNRRIGWGFRTGLEQIAGEAAAGQPGGFKEGYWIGAGAFLQFFERLGTIPLEGQEEVLEALVDAPLARGRLGTAGLVIQGDEFRLHDPADLVIARPQVGQEVLFGNWLRHYFVYPPATLLYLIMSTQIF